MLMTPGKALALTAYQDAGSTYAFSQAGNATVTFSPPKTFPGFNPAAVPPSHVNATLYGYRYFLRNVTLSGSYGIGSFTGPFPIPYSITPSVTFGLDSIVPSGGTVEFSIPANTLTGTLTATNFYQNHTLNTTVPLAYSPDLATPPPPSQFTTPNQSSTDFYSTSWSSSPSIANTSTTNFQAVISGEFGLQYVYTYVPGPLPILGAGAAFGWSRRIRRRIAKSA
ncbi:MAG: hypothetical protein ACK587_02995 [Cyanobacteriota bacterium]